MDSCSMAELLFADIKNTPEFYENKYPLRNLGEGAIVTRFAPSPTGFLHIGGLFAAFVAHKSAQTTGGAFFLRIEDTDKKREVENGVSLIVQGLKAFGIEVSEGMLSETDEAGAYGPYTQSKRVEIYQTFVKDLVSKGLAYPCFLTEDELAEIRKEQEEERLLPGCYGKFAKYRDITVEEAARRIDAGQSYVLRLKSPGDENKRIKFKDKIRGEVEMPENIQDVVILKSDGVPTYHFAHAIDDHLMRTTDVIRGDEWLSSVPIHLQLFQVLGFKPPKYSHISPIMKEDNGGKRKLSKRKDPEAAVSYYEEAGYTAEAVIEYLLTLANSNYEQWRSANKELPSSEFKFALNKMSKSGALFDLQKLNDISKTVVSKLDAKTVYDNVLAWSKKHDNELYSVLSADEEYGIKVFGVERGNKKPRKDITTWSDVHDYIAYYYDDLWDGLFDWPENVSSDDCVVILSKYLENYNHSLSAEDWFPCIRDMAETLGYAPSPKLYKNEPDSYKGHVGDVSTVVRVALTGRQNTPDLYSIEQVIGEGKVRTRLDKAIKALNGGN